MNIRVYCDGAYMYILCIMLDCWQLLDKTKITIGTFLLRPYKRKKIIHFHNMRYTVRSVVNLVSHELLLYHNYIIEADILSGLCALDPV